MIECLCARGDHGPCILNLVLRLQHDSGVLSSNWVFSEFLYHLSFRVFCSLSLILFFFINERERETLIFFVPFIHAFIVLVCAMTGDQTCNLGVSGRGSDQRSYPARA